MSPKASKKVDWILREDPPRTFAGRAVYPMAQTWQIAERAQQAAETAEEGSFLNALVAIVFGAFTFEALLNEACSRRFHSFPERLSWRSKAKELHRRWPEGKLSWKKEPFRTVQRAFEFRNAMAHARPEFLMQVELAEPKKETEWEAFCSVDNAKAVLKAVEEAGCRLWRPVFKDWSDDFHEPPWRKLSQAVWSEPWNGQGLAKDL